MTWLQRYQIRHYVGNSFWVFPMLSIPAALVTVRLLHSLEEELGWQSAYDPDTARAVLGMMASAMFTFIVFVSSALLVSVQLASAQLTPRIIGIVFKDPITRVCSTLFVFTFTFTLAGMIRIQSSVPTLTAVVPAYSCLVSLVVFFILIDHVGKALRPSGALWSVGRLGRAVIESVYPRPLAVSPEASAQRGEMISDEPTTTIASPRDGVVLAVDIDGLAEIATSSDCLIEMVPQVGDFVAAGDPLFQIFRGTKRVTAAAFFESVAIGQERTLEQDPTFAFRIIVDIASKGLSPAINDPTTAVLAIDQIHHLLRNVGNRQLDDGCVRDAAGRVRLVYRTPNWDDFVHLAVTEIRHFGSESIQVARRLRAMLENLIQTLPPDRRSLLRQELDLLRRSAERFFTEPEDRALADVGDAQGVGGKRQENQSGETPNGERRKFSEAALP